MKTFIMAFIALLLISAGAQAQFQKGDWELGMTFAAGSYSQSGQSESGDYDYDAKYLALALLPGYYLLDGLSLEPEFNYYTMENSAPTFQLLGNLSYTRWLPGQRAAWFVRAGAGAGNGVPYPGTNLALFDTGESIFILNFGAGLKSPISRSVALRTELNYKLYRYTRSNLDNYGYSSGSTDYDIRDFSIRIGFSILL